MRWYYVFLVGIGGCLGSMLRYAAYLAIKTTGFPFATFVVNLVGSFIIGVIWAIGLRHSLIKREWRLFLATGFCGGFTTFSAFTLENLNMLKTGQYGYCIAYVAGSVVLGIFAAYLGFSVVR